MDGRLFRVVSSARRLASLGLLTSGILAACSGSTPGSSSLSLTADVKAALPPAQAQASTWTAPIGLTMVPAAGAVLSNGKVMFWAADTRFTFGGNGNTWTSLFDPATNTAVETNLTSTHHDMFCPGTARLADGRLLVNGGLNAEATSIYDPVGNTWSTAATMNTPRGYNSTATLQDGSILTLGGSWSGPNGGTRNGELYTPATGWKLLSGLPEDPYRLDGTYGGWQSDAHMALIPTSNGKVLLAGPSVTMAWIDVNGNNGAGASVPAGPRGDDIPAFGGPVVMYDAGKILKVGGSTWNNGVPSSATAYIIDTTQGSALVTKLPSMAYPRLYSNSVVLPNGQVLIIGGQTFAQEFSDAYAVLAPELFDPATQTFTVLPAMSVARNYHSIGLLLPDARVISAGGGLCGCSADHPDMQIMAPPYLFNPDGSPATRPVITSAPATVGYGTTAGVTTDSAVTSFSLIRIGSTTHTVNNGQRRVALSYTANGGNSYTLNIPSNPGILIPGQWMLFALNAQGTPSVAAIVSVSNSGSPVIQNPGTQNLRTGQALYVALSGTGSRALTWTASNLPAGVTFDGAGAISGTPLGVGTSFVTISATDGTQTVSTDFQISVTDTGTGTGLTGEYFNNKALTGSPLVTRVEQPYFDWGTGSPAPGTINVDGFSTRWTGFIQAAASGTTALSTVSDDGVRVWVDGKLVIDNWTDHGNVTDVAALTMVAGQKYSIAVQYYENGGGAVMQLLWQPPGTPAAVPVPLERLYPATILAQTNIALGRSASQSSTQAGGGAALAVDGNLNGNFGAAPGAATIGAAAQDWWQVDLGAVSRIDAVQLYNRTDCCAEFLRNFFLLVSSTDMTGRTLDQLRADPAVTVRQVGATNGVPDVEIPVNGNGRYVRVQLLNTNALYLAEVVVAGSTGAPTYHTPTLTAPASQSTLVGSVVNLQPTASDPDGNALTWSATGLPTGLSISTTSGAISGTAGTPGSFAVTLTVANAGNLSATASFSWTVTGGGPPAVTSLPAPAAASGAAVTYTPVISNGAGVTYSYDFGDGTAPTAGSPSPNATHTYAAAGTYNVTLSLTASDGTTTTQSFLQAVYAPGPTTPARASSNLALEPRSGGNARLWVVNQDNDTVSVFDSVTGTKQAELNVGAAPRSVAVGSDGSIWVSNKLSATLSKIDPSTLAVSTVALARASQPFGLVVSPTDGSLFVALEATGTVIKLAANGASAGSVAVGPAPRHLALSADGSQLLVSRFISRPLPGEGTATVSTTDGAGNALGGEVVVVNPATLALVRTLTLANSTRPDTEASGRGLPNYLGAAAISPDGKSAWVPSKQDDILRGTLRDGNGLNFQNTVRSISSRLDLTSNTEDLAGRIDHDNAGLASAALYHPTGVYLFVALETNRQVAVIDAAGKRELFRFEVGLAPEGLALSADGLKLYVSNFMDRNVSVIDLTRLVNFGQSTGATIASWKSVGTEKLAAGVLKGKQLFYDARDPRLARDSYMSCATCHNDGGHDGRTWDFTGQGEGLRNTIVLKGRGGMGQGFLHWSANFDEVQDFEGQIRTLAGGTGLMTDAQFNAATRSQPLGTSKAGISADLDALAAYLASLNVFPSSPYRNTDGTLTAAAAAGQAVFQASNCASCHGGTSFSLSGDGSNLKSIGTLKPSSGSRLGGVLNGIDIPTLRDAWATAPYLHDGSASDLAGAIAAHTGITLNATDLANVAEYVRQIGGEETAAPLNVGTQCATEGGTCALPFNVIATVSYGANNTFAQVSGATGNVACNSGVFGDPAAGTARACYYVQTGSINPLPIATLSALPAGIPSGATTTLTWSSTNATACAASGGWTGAQGISGTFTTGALTATTTFTLTCSGAGGTSAPASATVTVTPVTPAPTVALSATPPSIVSGGTSTLTWSSTNATACAASGGWTGAQGVSGSVATAALTTTTTYTLTCTGAGGTSAPASATVTVTAPPPVPTVTLSAAPASIASGGSSTLTWLSTDATACTASNGWSGARAVSGTLSTGVLNASTTYTLTCTGAGGTSAPASATVTVTPPPTVTLTAVPSSITAGATTTLTWSSANATACTASDGWSGARAISGTFTTGALAATTTFTLTCTGAGGTSLPASAAVTVTPVTPVPIVTISALPASVSSGATSTLTWSTTNATACTASGGWSGAQPVSGSFTTGGLTANTTFTLTCTGAGGTSVPTSTTVTVTPIIPVPTVTLNALPTTVTSGATATLTWSTTNAASCTASGGWAGAQPVSGSFTTGALSANTTFTLTCTGAGGTSAPASATVTVTPVIPVPAVTLSALPTTVTSGGTTMLTWSTTNATACTASGGWSGAQPVSGSFTTGALSANTTFTLTCTGAGGTSAPASTTVTVTPVVPVPIVTISALPASISSGATSTVTWSTTNASSCTASGGWSGAQPVSGTFTTGALSTNTTFTLTCTGAGGSSAPASTTVTVTPVIPVPTVTLSALPTTVTSGSSSTLTWSTTNASSCAASGGWSGTQPVSGSFTTGALSTNTTFTLTCTGAGGTSAPASATVTVTPVIPVPTVTLSATPTTVTSGGTSTLTWSSTNATACTASNGWTGARSVSGTSTTAGLTANTTFTLTCTGAGGTSAPASTTVTVTPVVPVPTVTLNATPASVASGATATLTWSSTNATACTASGGWSGAQAISGTSTTAGLTANTTFTLTCTGAGGTSTPASATVTVIPVNPVPTATLSASPPNVASGGVSTLTWSSTNATSCTSSNGWTGTRAVSGTFTTPALTASTTYTLTCSGAGGTSAPVSTTVTVAAAGPVPTITLSALPNAVTTGKAGKLTWSTTNASSCTASNGWTGAKATSGTFTTPALTVSTTYTLTCTGSGGATTAASTAVNVLASLGTQCAPEGSTCTLPANAIATVTYGAQGTYYQVFGKTGSVGCSNSAFPDPAYGFVKACYYVVTGTVLTGTGTGLKGQYYATNSLTGAIKLTRNEAVNFSWGAAAPGAGVPADNFSVRWTGFVQAPLAGSYAFQTNSDDGIRVWVNGVQIINNWTAHAATLNTGTSTVTLAAGQQVSVTIEYQELAGDAVAQFSWKKPNDTSFSIVPLNQLYPAP